MTELSEIEFLYLGKRKLQSGKIAHLFALESQIEEVEQLQRSALQDKTNLIDRSASLFEIKKNPPRSIGAVYKAKGEITDGKIDRLVSADVRYASSPKSEMVAKYVQAWKTMNDAVELSKRIESVEKNSNNDPSLLNAMNILKDRYRRIPAGYRRGFQMWLIDELDKRQPLTCDNSSGIP